MDPRSTKMVVKSRCENRCEKRCKIDAKRHPQMVVRRNTRHPLIDTYEFEDLNHLFQHCKTGMPNEYALIEQTISIDVLNYIFRWLEMKTK